MSALADCSAREGAGEDAVTVEMGKEAPIHVKNSPVVKKLREVTVPHVATQIVLF